MLTIKNSYTNKTGQEIPLKTPKMKIMGKLMDENETHQLTIMGKAIKCFNNNGYPNNTIMLQYEGSNDSFCGEISSQLMGVMRNLGLNQFDKVQLTRGMSSPDQSGAVRPTVEMTILAKGTGPSIIIEADNQGAPSNPVAGTLNAYPQTNTPIAAPNNTVAGDDTSASPWLNTGLVNDFISSYKGKMEQAGKTMSLDHALFTWFKSVHKEEKDQMIIKLRSGLGVQ